MGEVKSDPEHPCPGCKHTEFVERLFRICTVCKTRVGAPEEKEDLQSVPTSTTSAG